MLVCRNHGGATRQSKAVAVRRGQKVAALEYASKMLASPEARETADPAALLLDSLVSWDALARYWTQLCAFLDIDSAEAGGLRGSLDYSPPTDELDVLAVSTKEQLISLNRHGEAQIHPFVIEMKDALKERAKVADMCLKAGIAERKVRLAEEQGQMMVRIIRGVVRDCERMTGQSIMSRPEFPGMVRRHLALGGGEIIDAQVYALGQVFSAQGMFSQCFDSGHVFGIDRGLACAILCGGKRWNWRMWTRSRRTRLWTWR